MLQEDNQNAGNIIGIVHNRRNNLVPWFLEADSFFLANLWVIHPYHKDLPASSCLSIILHAYLVGWNLRIHDSKQVVVLELLFIKWSVPIGAVLA